MATTNKPVMESIAFKMKGFAQDLYKGIAQPTVGRSIKNLNKQVEQVTGEVLDKKTKQLMVDAGKVAKENSEATLGYKAGNFLSGGIHNSAKDYKKAKTVFANKRAEGLTGEELAKYKPSLTTAIKNGHSVFDEDIGERYLNPKAVAGTAMAVGIAGRVATGGGLYRDQYGNFNVPGIPFI